MNVNNKNIRNLFVLLLLIFTVNLVDAQEFNLSAKFDKDTIIVGEHNAVNIEANLPKHLELLFPEYKDTLSSQVEVLLDSKTKISEDDNYRIYNKNILVTSFDTGRNVVAGIPFMIVENADTNYYITDSISIFVKPYVLLDTIPVDTIYANRSGFIAFGKDGFKKEIEKYIPDSIKQSVSSDSLIIIKEAMKEHLTQLFSSELTQHTGLYNQEEILKIAESSTQKMFIVDKGGIAEDFIVAGSVDTVFVQEYQQVQQNQPLFTLYRIKDINDELYNTPFNLAEFWYYFKIYLAKYWWALALLLIVVGAIIFFFKYYRKDIKPTFLRIKPQLPAHIIALEKLENIRNQKIWAKGQIKEFHVQLTDVVREYIENRFGIYAVEMTSSEILEAFGVENVIVDTDFMKLRQILEIADAVKFAKYQALQNENDLALRNAFEFVESTKEIIEENLKEIKVEAEIEMPNEETQQTLSNSKDTQKDETNG
ncbi:MAG: hypothetical protein PHP52_10715 [Bacteroidales bacterium]|nr:hypothetical protein [Bacteroidales bacterium]